jgi:hypothetical protein
MTAPGTTVYDENVELNPAIGSRSDLTATDVATNNKWSLVSLVRGLLAQVLGIKSATDNTAATAAAIGSSVDGVETLLQSVLSAVDSLESEMGALRTDVAAVRTDAAAVKTRLGSAGDVPPTLAVPGDRTITALLTGLHTGLVLSPVSGGGGGGSPTTLTGRLEAGNGQITIGASGLKKHTIFTIGAGRVSSGSTAWVMILGTKIEGATGAPPNPALGPDPGIPMMGVPARPAITAPTVANPDGLQILLGAYAVPAFGSPALSVGAAQLGALGTNLSNGFTVALSTSSTQFEPVSTMVSPGIFVDFTYAERP